MSKNRTDSSKTLTATLCFRQPSALHSLGLTYSCNPKHFQAQYYVELNKIIFFHVSLQCDVHFPVIQCNTLPSLIKIKKYILDYKPIVFFP